MTFEEWAEAFEARDLAADNHVADDRVADVRVSTVWLGLDHNFLGVGPPLIFETMIFGGPHDGFCERYATEEQAKAGHRRVLAAIRDGRDPEED